MTKEMLFKIGLYSYPAKHIIPRHLRHTLPRPCRVNGHLTAEFWYFSVEAGDLGPDDYIKMYAAIDVQTGELVRLRTFRPCRMNEESFETGYYSWRISHGKRYLRQCAKLLSQDLVSDHEIERLQQRWLELQPGWVKNHASICDMLNSDRRRPARNTNIKRRGEKDHA